MFGVRLSSCNLRSPPAWGDALDTGPPGTAPHARYTLSGCLHGDRIRLISSAHEPRDRDTNEPWGGAVLNVLFLCTGNSARSILAEALMNYPSIGGGKFRALSAGSHPKGAVHPIVLELLEQHGIQTDGLRSKSWEEFAAPDAPPLHFVFTVCDQAATEPCPTWPGQPMTAHWGVPDPAAFIGPASEGRRAFLAALLLLRRRIELFASLPLDKLSRLALQDRLDDIGRQPERSPDSSSAVVRPLMS